MKKNLIFMVVAILLGGITGKILFFKYDNIDKYAFKDTEKVYFLQEGVYSTKDSLESNTKNIIPKLVVKDNNEYYVYVGITKNKDNAKKIKKIYSDKGYSVYNKQKNISNSEFLSNVEQFDILVKNTEVERDISTIQEVVLSNYEEMVINKG